MKLYQVHYGLKVDGVAYLTEEEATQHLTNKGFKWSKSKGAYDNGESCAHVVELQLVNSQLFIPTSELEKKIPGNYCTEDDCIPRYVVEDADH